MASMNPRTFSRLGQSGSVFGLELMKQAARHPVKVVSADMSVVAGLDRFKREYPDSFYNVGIAEQDMMGIAAGLASEGFPTVAVAQACFLSMRSFEPVRQYLGYMGNNVVCVGINSGFSLSFFGNTHFAMEDMALMRTVPGMTVLSPADALSATKAFAAALEGGKPAYIRLSGGLGCPIVYPGDFDLEIGKAIRLREGTDVTLLATGSMVYPSLRAAGLLAGEGLSVELFDVHTVKPFDRDLITGSLDRKLLVTVEEHSVIGGLGSAAAEVLARFPGTPPLLKLGVQDRFVDVGDYAWLLEQARLTPECIASDILDQYRQL